MADSDERPATDETPPTPRRQVSATYRRPLGVGWVIALVAIPLLLGAVGYTLHNPARSTAGEQSRTAPTPTQSAPSQTTPSSAPPPSLPAGPAVACTNLQQEIHSVLAAPITFDTNTFTLTPNARQRLIRVADKLKACPSAKVEVNGYSDNTGDDSINLPLSEMRANAVAEFLMGQGVTHEHFAVKGFGSANPVAGNATAEGRAQNRRVEIVVS